jgi:general secretion pathway protein E
MNIIANPSHDATTIGGILVDAGRLSQSSLSRAERLAVESGEPIVTVLTRLGLIGERELVETISQALSLPVIKATEFPEQPILSERISRRFLLHFRILPISTGDHDIVVAMANPLDSYALEALAFASGKTVLPRLASPSDIEDGLERLYSPKTLSIDAEVKEDNHHDDVERLRDMSSDAPVIRLVNSVIARAVEARASDIHFEPAERSLRVRFRVDGVLQDIETLPERMSAPLTSRIKIMAKLNIAERRLAQDGRIRFAVRGQEIDFRVSTMPTLHGESVVLRILDRGSLKLDFEALGFDDDVLGQYLPILRRPHGILLVTGPTGSGKTTTLYTSLSLLDRHELKILTIEDPIEYQLENINQTQVKPQIGLTFASALRAFLRQDPDVIMVGEIRDLETAEIAVQASLTGHMILSTLHTNDAASAVTRLLDMGVENYLITSTVNAVLAQRLVRTLCLHCREPYEPSAELMRNYGLTVENDEAIRLFHPGGCPHCRGTGFQGRTTITEFLVVSDRIRELILSRAEALEIQRAAISEGMRTMFTDGMRKALAGTTTLEEVIRVTREN